MAGASPPPPCALASKPTASTAQSTSSTPTMARICSSSGVLSEMSTVSQPNERACSQPFLVHVADDDDGGAEQLGRVGRGEPDRACARDVDRRAGGHPRGVAAVVAGGEDVREHGEIADLLQGLVPVGELQQVEVGEGDHDVLGLSAEPAAHVDVAVGRTGPGRVDVEADAGLALVAVAAAAAGDVEGDGADVADLEELDVGALLDDLAGDLVAQRLPGGGGGAAADHVLVAAADVGGDVARMTAWSALRLIPIADATSWGTSSFG